MRWFVSSRAMHSAVTYISFTIYQAYWLSEHIKTSRICANSNYVLRAYIVYKCITM